MNIDEYGINTPIGITSCCHTGSSGDYHPYAWDIPEVLTDKS